jgi:hypothetical protein
MAVSLSVLHPFLPLAPRRFLVLISVTGWIDHRAIVRLEGLCELKTPITLPGIKTMTFRLPVQCLNQLHYCFPFSVTSVSTFHSQLCLISVSSLVVSILKCIPHFSYSYHINSPAHRLQCYRLELWKPLSNFLIYFYIYKNVTASLSASGPKSQSSESRAPMALQFGHNLAGEWAHVWRQYPATRCCGPFRELTEW